MLKDHLNIIAVTIISYAVHAGTFTVKLYVKI